jgi:putative aldouronate transport system substrate-binding protein
VLPAHLPSTPVKADIPSVSGGGNGVATDPGFLSHPADRVATVSGVPGKGGSCTSVTPRPRDRPR